MIYTFFVLAFLGILAFRAFDHSKASEASPVARSVPQDPLMNYLGGLCDSSPDVVIGGKQVFRPTWGARLLIPAILFVLLLTVDFAGYQAKLPADQLFVSQALIYVTLIFMLYQWIMLMFVYRVSIEGNSITSYGYSVFAQTRDLRELTDVQILANKGQIKFCFQNAKPIYTMRYISQRDAFFATLHKHTAQDTRSMHQKLAFKSIPA